MSMNCPKTMTKREIPSILKQENAANFKSNLLQELKSGQAICLDLDSVQELDLAGYNALVVAAEQARFDKGMLYLSLEANPRVLEFFDYAGMTDLLNKVHGQSE